MSLDNLKNNWLFYMGCIVGLFVILQSVFFIRRSFKQGEVLGMDNSLLKRTVFQSTIFAIVPSIAILLTIVTLSKSLGLNLPWIRLSVIGAITYEVPAATSAASVYGYGIGEAITDPVAFSNIAWVMTAGSIVPLILIPLFFKRYQSKLADFRENHREESELYSNALFLGMISSFLGYAISGSEANGIVYGSVISILTLLTSAMVMIVCGLLIKKLKIKWLENFAVPFSMIVAMVMSVVFFTYLPEAISVWQFPGLF
jgi:hypothetical protein